MKITMTKIKKVLQLSSFDPKKSPVHKIMCEQTSLEYHEQHMIRLLRELDLKVSEGLSKEEYIREMQLVIQHAAVCITLRQELE